MDREVIHLMRYFKLGQTIKCEENPIECNCTADEITITFMQGPKIVQLYTAPLTKNLDPQF